MSESSTIPNILRNLGVYGVGVALAVVGALGLSQAIELSMIVSGAALVVGLVVVVAVHEYIGGPIY